MPHDPQTSPSATAWRQTLAENLASLYRVDPEFARTLDLLPADTLPVLEPTRDTSWTTQVVADDGAKIYAHSRYRPLDEAKRLAEAQPESDLPAFLVCGMGLGHHVAALEARFDGPMLVVVEPEPELIKAALCLHDFHAAIDDQRLVFVVSGERTEFYEKLSRVSVDLLLGFRVVAPLLARRKHAAFFQGVRQTLLDYVAYEKIQLVTTIKIARVSAENMTLNLRHFVAGYDVDALANRAAGYPAIVVAAGPSLARNIQQLAGLREHAVIIAVQTVLKTLLAHQAPPHFVTSLDYHVLSSRFFTDVGDVGAFLVAEPKAHPSVLDTFVGPRALLGHELLQELLLDAYPQRGRLRAGSTVAHLAFYLAEHLGCDPIIFVGQDLCFPEGLYYAPGMPIEKVWRPEQNRFYTVEMKQWERIVRARGILRRATDIHGRPAYTDDQMHSYAEQFQADFARTNRRIIHACEGGMPLAGMRVMTLAEATEQYCRRRLPAELSTWPAPEAVPVERIEEALRARFTEVEQVAKIAAETEGILERLAPLVEQPRAFNALVAQLDDRREAMKRMDRTYRFVEGVTSQALLRRHTTDRRLQRGGDGPDATRRWLERDREFVAGFRAGCDFWLDVLPRAIERLRERDA